MFSCLTWLEGSLWEKSSPIIGEASFYIILHLKYDPSRLLLHDRLFWHGRALWEISQNVVIFKNYAAGKFSDDSFIFFLCGWEWLRMVEMVVLVGLPILGGWSFSSQPAKRSSSKVTFLFLRCATISSSGSLLSPQSCYICVEKRVCLTFNLYLFAL